MTYRPSLLLYQDMSFQLLVTRWTLNRSDQLCRRPSLLAWRQCKVLNHLSVLITPLFSSTCSSILVFSPCVLVTMQCICACSKWCMCCFHSLFPDNQSLTILNYLMNTGNTNLLTRFLFSGTDSQSGYGKSRGGRSDPEPSQRSDGWRTVLCHDTSVAGGRQPSEDRASSPRCGVSNFHMMSTWCFAIVKLLGHHFQLVLTGFSLRMTWRWCLCWKFADTWF